MQTIKIKFIALSALFLLTTTAWAQTTAFTYQGKLTNSGNSATGNYDIQFHLFDNANAGQGTQQGTTFTNPSVPVTNGIFTVQLDFGAAVFATGADLYLEISLRPAGSTGGYTSLAPRQRLTSAPYSIRALNAGQADAALDAQKLGGAAPSQYVQTNDARLTNARTPTAGSANYIQNTTTQQAGANFNISGSGIIGGQLRAYGLNSLPAVYGSSATSYGLYGISESGSGVYGRSGSQGSIALQANGTSWFSGNTTPLNNTSGTGIGIGTSPDFGFIYAYDYGASAPKTLALNNSGGNVGIGTITPFRTLSVNGRARISSIPVEASFGTVCFNQAGDLLQCGASSLRLKTNVRRLSSGLDIIKQLHPISFNWKGSGVADIGLGAEEVARVAPSLVLTNGAGKVEGVKYERLNIVLTNAVKEQQAQIESQQQQIKQQNQQIKQQQQQIDGLQKLVCGLQPKAEICQQKK